MKRLLLAASLLYPLAALAQDYPSPTLRNATVLGTLGVTGAASFGATLNTTGTATVPNLTMTGTLPRIQSTGRIILQRTTTAIGASDFADVQMQRDTTSLTTGPSSQINATARVITTIGPNDETNNWGFSSATTTSAGQVGAISLGAYLYARRDAATVGVNGKIIGSLSNAIDLTGRASSLSGNAVAQEIDVQVQRGDDQTNGQMVGGVGTRLGSHYVAIRNDASDTTQTEVSHGLWFSATDVSGTPDTHTNWKSLIGLTVNTQAYQGLDMRGAVAPTGYTDPVAAVRMSAGQIVDFNGGSALNSAAGRYFVYNSGSTKLQYMNTSATELFSIGDAGAASIAGTLSVNGAATFSNTVALSGATSALTIGNNTATTTPMVTLNAASGTRQIRWQTAGSLRQSIGLNTTAEVATVVLATNASVDPATPTISAITSAATASGNILTFASTTGIIAGQTVVATNVPANTRVTYVTSTQAFLDNSVTSTGVPITTTVRFGANRLPFASVAGVSVGMWVNGGGIGAKVTAINGTDVYLSSNTPVVASGTNITFSAATGGDLSFTRYSDTGGQIDVPLQIVRSRAGLTTVGGLNITGNLIANGVQGPSNATAIWANNTLSGSYSNTNSYQSNLLQVVDNAVQTDPTAYRHLLGISYLPSEGAIGPAGAMDVKITFSGRLAAKEAGGQIDSWAARFTGTHTVNQGGTGLSFKGGANTTFGNIRGALFVASAQGTASNLASVNGMEINLGISDTASAALEHGIVITKLGGTDITDAAVMSTHIQLANGGTASTWKAGLSFSNAPPGVWPFDTNSVMIDGWRIGNGTVGASRPAAAGADFLSVDFSRDAFRTSGTAGPWRVNQAGAMQVGTAMFTPASTGLTIDAAGAYATAVGVSAGGTGYTSGDYLYFGNGGIAYVATASAGGVTGVTVIRYPYLETAAGAPATYATTAGWNSVGSGAVLSITWNTTANGIVLAASGTKLGFYGTAAISKQTGVAVTAAGIHAALTALGLIAP